MAIQIVVPRLGWSMEEGTFGEWLKKDGETVELGEPLFVLEGEKSAQDIESVDRGILRIPPKGPRPGDLVKVGQVIAWFVEPGEAIPTGSDGGSSQVTPSTPASTSAPVAGDPILNSAIREHSTVSSGSAASQAGVAGGGACGAPIASPRARRAARDMAVDLSAVSGTGRTGRIREKDVMAAAHATGGMKAAVASVSTPVNVPQLTTVRRTIAARMRDAVETTASVTLQRRCDATNLVNLRSQFQAGQASRGVPTFTDLVVKLVGCVLVEYPTVRTQWLENGFFVPPAIDIAVAVDTEQGLLAPVVRGVDQLPLRLVSAEIRTLAESARAGKLTAEQLRGGAFTVTNLGAYGVESFTPIINLPQSAILGLGRIAREPVVRDEQIVIRDQLPLSLTFDHRILDGAPAAKFLQAVAQAIENPGPWLMG